MGVTVTSLHYRSSALVGVGAATVVRLQSPQNHSIGQYWQCFNPIGMTFDSRDSIRGQSDGSPAHCAMEVSAGFFISFKDSGRA